MVSPAGCRPADAESIAQKTAPKRSAPRRRSVFEYRTPYGGKFCKKIFERPNARVGVICSRSLPSKKWAVPWRDNRAAKSSETAGGSKRRRYSAAMLPTRSRGTALDVAKGWAMPTSCAMCATCRHRFAEMFFKEFVRDSRFTPSVSPQRRKRKTVEPKG